MKYDNKVALLRHRGKFEPEDVDAMYLLEVEHKPPPVWLRNLDTLGGSITYSDETLWGWRCKMAGNIEEFRSGYADFPLALQDWNRSYRAFHPRTEPKFGGEFVPSPLVESFAQAGHTRTHLAFALESLNTSHRQAAQHSVPSNVTISPDAKVEHVEKDGRITGVWVEAKVFVSLAAE